MARRGWHGQSARHSLAARGCRTGAPHKSETHVSIERYAPNFNMFTVGKMTFYFSYNTVVAYHDYEDGLVISDNIWSRTTGKHLNQIDPDKKKRVKHEVFERKLQAALDRHGLSVESPYGRSV